MLTIFYFGGNMNKTELAKEIINNLTTNKKIKKFISFLTSMSKGSYLLLRLINNEPGTNAVSLACNLGISKPRIAFLLNDLEEKEYLIREKNQFDTRKTDIKLTQKGKNILDKRNEEIYNKILLILNELNDEEIDNLIKLITKITNIERNLTC